MLDAEEQIDWCNARAADHFGLDPERDRRQRVTNLVRLPAFVALPARRRVRCADRLHQPARPCHAPGRRAGPTATARSCCCRRTSPSASAPRRCGATSSPTSSHEIRTPLTVLAGFVETLASVPLSSCRAPRVLALMRQQTDAHAGAGRRPADAGAARGQPAAADRTAGWPVTRSAGARAGRCASCCRRAVTSIELWMRSRACEIAGMRRRTGQRDGQPASPTPCATRPTAAASTCAGECARRRLRRVRGARHRHRHRARAPAAPDRALLPRRRQPLARDRRHRPGPVHRQACDAAPRRRDRDPERARQGFEFQAGLCPQRASGCAAPRRRAAARALRAASGAAPASLHRGRSAGAHERPRSSRAAGAAERCPRLLLAAVGTGACADVRPAPRHRHASGRITPARPPADRE